MNNLKKAGVMFLIATLTISMVFVPFMPMTQVRPVATPQVTTPEDVKMEIQRYLNNRRMEGPLDTVLASYRDTGMLASDVVTTKDGAVAIFLVLDDTADVNSLEELVDINWKVDVGAAIVASAYLGSPEILNALESFKGVVSVFADHFIKEPFDDETDVLQPIDDEPDAYANVPWIGADLVNSTLGFDGTGVRVGVIDTGTDFSLPDLLDALDIGPDGFATSFDAGGYGTVLTLFRVNATPVENITAWFEYSSWNLLSYEKDGKYFINGTYPTGLGRGRTHYDPNINNQNGYYTIDYFIDHYIEDIWWGAQPGGYPNENNLTDFYYDVMRQDLEIPDPQLAIGGATLNYSVPTWTLTTERVPYYCTGYAFQQRLGPYTKVFAPVLVLNGTHVVVDWNTTRGHTEFWMDAIYNGRYSSPLDFNNTAVWDYYASIPDWSFVDDWEAGKWYGNSTDPSHHVMYYDYPSDGRRFGLGTLARSIESIGFGIGLIEPIDMGGRIIGIMYDHDDHNHGTFTAGQIASRGDAYYPVGGPDGDPVRLPGVAPGATVSAIQAVAQGGVYVGLLYAAGFDLNFTSGYWEWNPDSTHQMDVASNSWGFVAPQYYELWGALALIYAAIATPEFFHVDYPGQVIAFSSGNSGPGYGTAGPPITAPMITVGATTSFHYFEDTYGAGQGFDQIAEFSSRGPGTLGYPKVDILAPGYGVWGLAPDYGDLFSVYSVPNYAPLQGTSMACPMVAGVAALMLDADPSLTPSEVKTIMMSTAVDIGADGLSQGAGRVDAFAAVDYVANDVGYMFSNTDSAANWAAATAEAWALDMNPYTRNTFINGSVQLAPDDFLEYSLYFGLVNEGDSVTMTINTDGNWVYSDFTWSAEQYVAGPTYTFSYETEIYNETTSDYPDLVTRGGWIDLVSQLGGDWTTITSYQYATISITGDQAMFGDDSIRSYIFDWTDTDPTNLRPDYYNGTHGDELKRIQSAGYTANVLKMDLSSATTLADLFTATPIIMIYDDNLDWPYTTGNMVDVTIQTWELAADANIATPIAATQGANVTLTVGAGTDYGIHQGFIIADSHRIPYTYNVLATYDANGTIMEIADGIGDVQTPYEHGTITAGYDSVYTYTSADHMTFVVNVTDSDVNYLAARVEWTNPLTDMDVDITDLTGWPLAESYLGVKESGQMAAISIAEIGGWTGLYLLYTYTNAIDGATIPENISITVVGLKVLDDPTVELTWTARDSPTPTVVDADGSASGDHVMMKATWTNGNNPGLPEFGITTIRMRVLYGTLFEETGSTHPAVDPGAAQGGGVIDPTEYEFVVAPGIGLGDRVTVTVDFDGSDVDVWLWWDDIPMGERTYANMISNDGISGNIPEVIEFIADQAGDLAVGIEDYAGDSTTYWVTVDNRVGLDSVTPVLGMDYEFDTYDLLANNYYAVLVDSLTGSNVAYSVEIKNIWIENFFAPEITAVAPVSLGNELYNFTWSATDQNADDIFFYSVWISADGGNTFQVVAQNLTGTFYVWNADGWFDRSYYGMVRVWSYDGVYLLNGEPLGTADEPPVSYGSYALHADSVVGPFNAGNVPIPTTPTTTTTTPPTTPTTVAPPPPLDPLLIGLIGGIGVGVVVLLILFLIRKK